MASIAPIARFQWSISGVGVAAGYKLFTYQAGTTTKKDTYTTRAASVANTNPIILDSNGSATIFLDGSYKFVLTTPGDTDPPTSPIWTVDNIDSTSVDVLDSNGNFIVDYAEVASAVNYIQIKNAAAGNAPTISVLGTDSAINLDLKAKGNGGQIRAIDGNGNEIVLMSAVSGAVNEVTITNASTGNSPTISSSGSDTNINIDIKPKGTGQVRALDSSGNEILLMTGVASAVNELRITNAATGVHPTLRSSGEANIGLDINDSNNNEILKARSVASAVNEIQITNAATTANPKLEATGGDTNIGLDIQSKGTGTYNLLGTSSQSARLRLYEDTDNGTNYAEFVPPASITANRTITIPDMDVDLSNILGVATQSDMETGTSTTAVVTPGRQHFHPAHAKVICMYDSAATIQLNYNVTSITDTGTGDSTLTIATDFSSANYVMVASAKRSNATIVQCATTQAAGSIRIIAVNDVNSFVDPDNYYVAMFGDQA